MLQPARPGAAEGTIADLRRRRLPGVNAMSKPIGAGAGTDGSDNIAKNAVAGMIAPAAPFLDRSMVPAESRSVAFAVDSE